MSNHFINNYFKDVELEREKKNKEMRTQIEKLLERKRMQLEATRESLRLVQNLLDEIKKREASLMQDIESISIDE